MATATAGMRARDATHQRRLSACSSSPDSYISVTMSQPPSSSPLTNSCGIVGQLEIAESSWRMRGSGRMSTAANGVSSDCSTATVRAEKPQAGASGVPFMNRITLCSAIASAIASRIGLRSRPRAPGRAAPAGRGTWESAHRNGARHGAPGSGDCWLLARLGALGWILPRRERSSATARGSGRRSPRRTSRRRGVLLDAAAAGERRRGHGRAEVVAAAGVVLDLGARSPGIAASIRCLMSLR